MQDVWQRLKAADEPIFLYGTGNGADRVLDELEELNIPVSGVFASDGFVRNRQFRNMPVQSFSSVKEANENMIALLCFGTSQRSVIENIKKISSQATLLMPSIPVYGEEIFNADYYDKNKIQIETAYELLADEKSKKTFENIINFRLTGDISHLFNCEESEEATEQILKLDEEIYVDLGAYRGDTVIKTSQKCKTVKAFAVEPDRRSFEKLKQNTAFLADIKYFNCAIGEKSGEQSFSGNHGRGSSVNEEGGKIQVISVDEMLNGEKVTFIKADVEGNEKATLLGAGKTIKDFKPKLRIAAYHRAEDIFSLPILINSLNSKYKIYLRHTHCIPDWDTDIFAV